MNDDRLNKMMEEIGNYDEAKEDSLRSMIGDFYNRKMLSKIILIWSYAIVIIAGAVFCAVRFFDTDSVRDQIMYATIFLTCVAFMSLVKIFAWQMIHRNGIKREIKRLELRIAELSQILGKE